MKTFFAKQYIQWLMRGADRIFFVYGMRRSGNHACIGWLINGLEGKSAPLTESEIQPNFNFSETGKTVFINDLTNISSRTYLSTLRRFKREIRAAQFIVISVEDRAAIYGNNWRIPGRSEPILVRRATLNLMASRYQNVNRRAREGWGASMQSMRSGFFTTLEANIQNPKGMVWQFERWRSDDDWRRGFLQELGLTVDIAPPMSPPGLGSSFTGTGALPSAEQLSERFKSVEPWEAWQGFISKSAAEYPSVFSDKELEIIATLSDG